MLDRPFCRFLFCCVAVSAVAGCSRRSGQEAALKRADAHFAAGDYEKAELEYKNVLASRGATNIHAISRLGVIYFEQGRLNSAARFLRYAVDQRPDDAEARLKLAQFEMGNNKPGDARQAAVAVLDKNPTNSEAPLIVAETSVSPGEVADARARFGRLPPALAASAPVLTALAILDLRERKLDTAEALLLRARVADPKAYVAPLMLSFIQTARSNPAAAERLVEEAANLAPPRSQLRLQVARQHFAAGRDEAGRQLLEEQIAKTPDFLPPYLVLAAQLDAGKKHAEAAALIDRVLAKEPDHPEALLLSAQARLSLGEKDRALSILDRAVTVYPGAFTVHHQLGLTRLAAGNTAGAKASFGEAVRLQPAYVPSILALARLQLSQGEFSNVEKTLSPIASGQNATAEVGVLLAAAFRGKGSLDEALKIYRQLIERFPDAPEFRHLEASVLIQQGRRPEARRLLTALVERHPSYLPGVEELCSADIAEKKVPDAIARMEAFVSGNPANAAGHFALANILVQQPDFAKAEVAARKALELQHDSGAASGLLSKIYIATNQTEKAIENLTNAAAKNPKDSGVHFLLGALRESQKDYKAARDAYEQALRINPKMGPTLNNLAHIYSEHLVDLDKALDTAQRAREAMPSQPEVADTLGWIQLKRGQYPQAIALLTESASGLPQDASVRYHLGFASYMLGLEADARNHLEQALKLDPNLPAGGDIRRYLEVLAIDPTSGAAARADLEKALNARSDDPVAHVRLGSLHEREGRLDAALASYAAALKTNPALMPAILGTLRLHVARKQPAQALAFGREARKTLPGDPQLAAALGRIAYQIGEFNAALGFLQEASRRLPDDGDVLLDLADASYAMGAVPSAENALTDALRVAPASPRAAKARQFLELIQLAQPGADAAAAAKAATAALAADPANVPAAMLQAGAHERSGDWDGARQAYDRILARYPDFLPAKKRLAIAYAALPEPPKTAVEIAATAREAYPGDAEVARAFGLILFRQGHFSRASPLLQDAARTLSGDAELHYSLGRTQHELKDAPAAKRSLERALELGLKGDPAQEARRLIAAAAAAEKK